LALASSIDEIGFGTEGIYDLHFLANGGEMGARMRALDWTRTPLGPPQRWPQSLKTIVRVMLDSRYAMWMGWGPQLTFFCNDAYLPTVGIKRDWILGARAEAVWQEIWPEIGPRIAHVLSSGDATWDDGLLLFLERSGFPEETYHTFSYSPVYDDASQIAGLLCVVTEVTERVIGERRLKALRDLAARSIGVQSVDDACRRAVSVMADYPHDVPLAALYMLDGERGTARLAASSLQQDDSGLPQRPSLAEAQRLPRFAELISSERNQRIDDLPAAGLRITSGQWSEPVKQALLLPMKSAGHDALAGFALLGVSPRRTLDSAYVGFLELLAGQTASAIAGARANEAERARAEALAQLDRAKTAFFSNVSHEFRTPLTLMMSPLEQALRAEPADLSPSLRDELVIAHRNSLRLLRLVNALLDFSRMEAGRMRASFEATDLSSLTAELAGGFRAAVERAGLTLQIECPPLPEPVYLDRTLWEQIVLNLVSNAFKYTLVGSIRVSVHGSATHASMRVTDTGTGIPGDALPHLFERFYRVPNARGRTFEGTGIGLALVHELVKIHGGSIAVSSQLDSGSSFTVTVPLGVKHLPADQVQPALAERPHTEIAEAFVQEALAWNAQPATSAGARGPAGAAELPPQSDSRAGASASEGVVLLVDDNADMRAYVSRLLRPHWTVVTAGDGVEALEQLERLQPDLVLSDVMMPRLDGFGLLAAIRAEERTCDMPVVLLSARAGEESRIEGVNASANDYLVKPFTARELIARVRAQTYLARLRREAKQAIRSAEQTKRAAVEALNRQLTLESEELRALFEQAPGFIAVLKGPEFVFALTNRAYRQLIGAREILGKPLLVALPELEGQSFPLLLRQVYESGEPYGGHSMPLRLRQRAHAPLQDVFVDFVYQPLKDAAGCVTGILVQGNDVTERKLMEDALRESDRRKDEFLAMLAHELRNPLAPILNATELLSGSVRDGAQTQAIAGIIKRQTAQMARLVDDLLDVSRITLGRIELRREAVEIGAVVNQALETVDPLLRDRHHEVLLKSHQRPLYVNGDVTRLAQCIGNVLTNAAKYTDPGGQIRLQIREQGTEVVLEIADNGVGISSELLPRIFDLFVQSNRTLDRSQGGLGIGLAVVRRLVEMHGGRVRADSEGLGRGARFEITLPLTAAPKLPPPPARSASAPARRILVVDDNVDAAQSLAQVLQLGGHESEAVYGALDAIERAQSYRPDVILLDIGLPRMDGYEVARRLRQLEDLQHVRLIAVTGYGQNEDRQRSLAAGFDAHLAKPVDFAALERELTGLTRGC
jgi:signal transduction histidine kinase